MRLHRSKRLLSTTILVFVFTAGTTGISAQNEQIAKNNSDTHDTQVAGKSAAEPALAVETPARSRPDMTLTTRVGIQSGQPVSLSLDEAIRKALSNNNTIEITRDDVRFQETQI